jgi:capsular polysaccharide biosynthesis protein
MPTELTLLQTRAVAVDAVRTLGSSENVDAVHASYHGTSDSNGIIHITASGSSDAIAKNRANAIAKSYLALRGLLAQQQANAIITALQAQQDQLRHAIAADTTKINNIQSDGGAPGTTLSDLLDDRAQRTSQVQQIDSTIQSDAVAAQSVAKASTVIDLASIDRASAKKTLVVNIITGTLLALILGLGVVCFTEIITTRVRRRSDIAAALQAAVPLSVGPIVRTRRWRSPSLEEKHGAADLQLVAKHLERALMTSASHALVIVSIDSLAVTTRAIGILMSELQLRDRTVAIVNETDAPLSATLAQLESIERPQDFVVVIAELDPAKGAAHLRAWASDSVAVVTAGATSEATLQANATMLRAASLHLASVVLVNADPADDSLGILEEDVQATSPAESGEFDTPAPIGSP